MAPFKLKFSRMSKSNSSTRSNSVESPKAENESDLGSPQNNVPAILEGNEGQETIPSSPPPSYEHVLEEVSVADSSSHNLAIFLTLSLCSIIPKIPSKFPQG